MASSERACVFIDGGYVRAMLHYHYSDLPIDFLKFSNELCQGCERFRTYYYMCPPYQSNPPTQQEKQMKSDFDKFISRLKLHPRFEIRLGRLQRSYDPRKEFEQKGVDVLLSIDLTDLSATGKVDKAIIVSADSDFAPAIQRAKENHMIVELASFSQHRSQVLFSLCDERILIDSTMIDRIRL